MDKVIQDLVSLSNQIGIQEGHKKTFNELIASLKKEKIKSEFKHSRFNKDKSIAINLLNATIEDLEKKKEIIEENNKKLLEHRQMIEHKNNVLESQKKRIVEQSLRLEENLEKLTDSYNELEQFTYIASHDLKSPLRTITNFGQLLKRREGLNISEEGKDFLDYIIKGTKQMNTVICDLLEFAHVGNKNKKESEFELEEVLNSVKFNLAEPIKESGAQILYDKLPRINGLRSSFIQLFQNIIGNAIKYRDDSRIPVIKIKYEIQEEFLYFEVKDNGVGMEEEYQEKAFKPFQRINNLERPGSGIGLAICKKVVNQHGGQIRYRSIRGEGTTFCFTLNKYYFKNEEEKLETIA